MSIYKRGNTWHYEFLFKGKRIRESANTPSKTVAKEAEADRRRELERALAGLPSEKREDRIRNVADFIKPYLDHYPSSHREQSIAFAEARLAHVRRLLGSVLISDLTQDVIRGYIKTRLKEGVAGRTINMELGELSRAIGKPWSELWPKVRKLEERKDVGRALSHEEERKLLDATAAQNSPNRSQILATLVRVALLTGMRSGEITSLRWGQIDFAKQVISVGRAKTSSGTGRQIPMNNDLVAVLAAHADWFTNRFGEANPELYLFPFGRPQPSDPTKPTTTVKTAWTNLRKCAGVEGRLHDLRHTALTKMAEAGTPESTMLALAGHMSRAMLERYSHIRMAAKRQAVESLSLAQSEPPRVQGLATSIRQQRMQ